MPQQRDSVLTERPPAVPPAPPRPLSDYLEVFGHGSWRTVLLLGPPYRQGLHRDKDLGKNVPCLPEPCARCADPAWRGTYREEGYAPAYRKNHKLLRWEQVLVVFTAKGLEALDALAEQDGRPHRGRQLRGRREMNGNSPWQVIEAMRRVGHDFPALPRAFDVLPFARLKWDARKFANLSPDALAAAGFELLPPIPFDDTPRRLPPERPELAAPPEVLRELHQDLLTRGMLNAAARVESELAALGVPVVEAVKVNGVPVPHAPPPAAPTPHASAEGPAGVVSIDATLDQLEDAFGRTGSIICNEQKGKRGAVLSPDEERASALNVVRGNFKVAGKNGAGPRGGAK